MGSRTADDRRNYRKAMNQFRDAIDKSMIDSPDDEAIIKEACKYIYIARIMGVKL